MTLFESVFAGNDAVYGLTAVSYTHLDVYKRQLRTLGKKAGALNLLCDCLKCIAAILIVRAIFGNSYGDILPLLSLYAAAGCILGHNFPFYLNFTLA